MANQDFNSPNTAATLGAAPLGNAKNIRQIWRKGALLAEQSTDFYQEWEGGENSLIWAQTDLSKGKGATMNFTTQSGFYKKPKLGDALFETAADFDQIRQGNFQLKVDYAKWAVRTNRRMEEIMGMRGDIESGVNLELGKNLGRFKTEQLDALFFYKLPTENIVYSGGKTKDTLSSTDTLLWDEVVTTGQAMMPLGGLPAKISGPNSNSPIWSQTFVATTAALLALKLDDDYKNALKEGDVRGRGNTIFSGGYPSIDGHTIVPRNPIDHDGVGPMGSFLNPKAYVGGTAITYAASSLVVKGGGNATDMDSADFFRYFDGSPYEFIDTGALTNSSETRYFIIYNTTDGKWGMYAYTTGNTGSQITCTARLAGTASGTAHTTIGGAGNVNGLGGTAVVASSDPGVTWNAAINTTEHPLGSLILPCNCKGVLLGDTLAFGRGGILRGYGECRAEHETETHNGKFVTDRFLLSTFGQSFKYDRKDRVTSVMRLRHAIMYPGLKLPGRN